MNVSQILQKVHAFLGSKKLHVILGILFLSLSGITYIHVRMQEAQLAKAKSFTVGTSYGEISIRVFLPIDKETYNCAVIGIHGFSGNKNNLRKIAMDVVNADIPYIGIDLPGHGESEGYIDMNLTRLSANLAPVMKFTETLLNLSHDRIIILGHSLGGGIAIIMGAMYNLSGVIAFAPVPPRVWVNTTSPRNVLVLYGEKDEAQPLNRQLEMMKLLTGEEKIEFNRIYGNIENGTAREFRFFPGADHFSIVENTDARKKALSWICSIARLPTTSPVKSISPGASFILALTGAPFIVLMIVDVDRKNVNRENESLPDTGETKKLAKTRFLKFLALAGVMEIPLFLLFYHVVFPLAPLPYPVLALVPLTAMAVSIIVINRNYSRIQRARKAVYAVVGTCLSAALILALGARGPFYVPTEYRIILMIFFAVIWSAVVKELVNIEKLARRTIKYEFKTITGEALYATLITGIPIVLPYQLVIISTGISFAFQLVIMSIFPSLFFAYFSISFFRRIYNCPTAGAISAGISIAIGYVLLSPVFPGNINDLVSATHAFLEQVFWG